MGAKNMNILKKSSKEADIVLLSALFSFVLLLSGFSSAVVADSFTPFNLLGYAQYSSSGWAQGATVDAHNDDTNDWIYNVDTVESSGQWVFNIGSNPGPGWSDGDQVTIYIDQEGTNDYQGWNGQKTITVNMAGPHQDCGTITLNPPPAPGIPGVSGPATGVINTAYNFDATATDPGSIDIKYMWDWNNDGSVDEESGWKSSGSTDTRSHSWSTTGSKTIKVKAKNKGSQESSWGSHTINILSQPPNTPSAPSGPSSGDHNTLYTYTTSTTDPENDNVYYWFDWNDGTNSGWVGPYSSGSTGSASHSWSSPGTFNIKVKAKDTSGAESGWSSTTTVTMDNSPPPVPNTPTGETSGHHGTSYSYSTNTVTDPEGDSVQYKFDWDDGSDSGWLVSPSSSHSWDEPGTYSVRVKSRDVWDESSWSSTLSVNIDNRAPNDPSTPSGPTEGNKGQSYTYTTSSSDPDGDSLEYLFDWGDSSNSGWGSSSASHAWSGEGTFQVKAKCRDDWDESGWSNTLSIIISGGPQVDADGPYYANAGDSIQFEGSASDGDPPYTWHWTFGDGGTSTNQNPTHTYSEPDLYNIRLVVTDSSSNQGSDTTFAYIGVGGGNPSPNAHGPYSGYIGEYIQFTGSVINGTSPYTWHWDFGDGNSSTEQNPTHAYNAEDTYTVILTVEDSEDKTGTDTTTATIEAVILEPDLECQGSLNWADIKPGVTVTGSFTVSNTGDPETLLNWEISEYPEWGTWTFTPESGIGLTPEDGSVTIEVTVEVPDEKNQEFSGSVIVKNSVDPSDNCEISVSLITPKNKMTYLFWQFMLRLIDRFPFLETFIDLQ